MLGIKHFFTDQQRRTQHPTFHDYLTIVFTTKLSYGRPSATALLAALQRHAWFRKPLPKYMLSLLNFCYLTSPEFRWEKKNPAVCMHSRMCTLENLRLDPNRFLSSWWYWNLNWYLFKKLHRRKMYSKAAFYCRSTTPLKLKTNECEKIAFSWAENSPKGFNTLIELNHFYQFR